MRVLSAPMLRCSVLVYCLCGTGVRAAGDEKPAALRKVERYQDSIEPDGPLSAIAFSPDGARVVIGNDLRFSRDRGPTGEAIIWDLKTRTRAVSFTGHTKPVVSVAFSPDGKVVASSAAEATVRVWDAATGKQIAAIKDFAAGASHLTFSPDGRFLAGITRPSEKAPLEVLLWDVGRGAARARLEADEQTPWGLAFSPDGKLLAVGCAQYDAKKNEFVSGELRIWDVGASKLAKALRVKRSRVQAVAFSPDGKTVAAAIDTRTSPPTFEERGAEHGAGDGVVRLWDRETWAVLAEVKVDITCAEELAFSPDGRILVYRTGPIRWSNSLGATWSRYEVVLLDAKNLKTIAKLPSHEKGYSVEAVAFDPRGRFLATGESWELKFWKVPEVGGK